jgi:hypothetical protein
MASVDIDEILLIYLREKIEDDLEENFKEKLIKKAVRFNINESIYTKFDFIGIDYGLKLFATEKIMELIKTYSLYGYLLYRAIETQKPSKEIRVYALKKVIDISNIITNYINRVYNEEELKTALHTISQELNPSQCSIDIINSLIPRYAVAL